MVVILNWTYEQIKLGESLLGSEYFAFTFAVYNCKD
jgi:hypothetical protein